MPGGGLFPIFKREKVDKTTGRTPATAGDVFSSLIFLEVKIEDDPNTDNINETETIPALELIDIILSISKTKNIVETEVQNRVGSVNEYISDGDYNIRVRGVLASDERTVAPAQLARLLDRHLSLGQSLEVASFFLEDFKIHTVVVLDYDISEITATRNNYDIRINMRSEKPIELEVSQPIN